MDVEKIISKVTEIVFTAGNAIKTYYDENKDIQIIEKSDQSPLTQADLQAHHIILSKLQTLTPDIPILSEESDRQPNTVSKQWNEFWLVDPLDGTKEFINRTGEFTVNIALVRDQMPCLGVIGVPMHEMVYYGAKNFGAYKVTADRKSCPINVSSLINRINSQLPIRVVVSRRHGKDAVDDLVTKLQKELGSVETVPVGSSLKMCLIAEGLADVYPRLAPTCYWDTAAAQAILEAAGGRMFDDDFKPLECYPDQILNPNFFAIGDISYPWQDILRPLQ